MTAENWKPVPGYEGFYEVSDKGRVKALFAVRNIHKAGRILKPWLTNGGYVQVHLMIPGTKRKAFSVHTLLLEAFIKARPAKLQCRHLNGRRSDNRLENLKWGSAKENQDDRRQHGTALIGEDAPPARLNQSKVLQIREAYKTGSTLDVLGNQFSVHRTTIWNVVQRKTWSHA